MVSQVGVQLPTGREAAILMTVDNGIVHEAFSQFSHGSIYEHLIEMVMKNSPRMVVPKTVLLAWFVRALSDERDIMLLIPVDRIWLVGAYVTKRILNYFGGQRQFRCNLVRVFN